MSMTENEKYVFSWRWWLNYPITLSPVDGREGQDPEEYLELYAPHVLGSDVIEKTPLPNLKGDLVALVERLNELAERQAVLTSWGVCEALSHTQKRLEEEAPELTLPEILVQDPRDMGVPPNDALQAWDYYQELELALIEESQESTD